MAETAQPREPGWYWVRWPYHKDGGLDPARWNGTAWFPSHKNLCSSAIDPEWVGPRIPSPASRPDPLAARLVELRDVACRLERRERASAEHAAKHQDFDTANDHWRDAEALKAIIAALAGRDGWRDISTAPKGRCIDIWITEDDGSGRRWGNCYYDSICDQWRTIHPSGHIAWVPASAVTHWREEPAPPRPEGGG